MSGISSIFARTSTLMSSNQLLARLRDTQLDLLEAQKQITTGKQVLRPSDAPDKASAILYLRQSLAAREQHGRNLDHAWNVLNYADQALGDTNAVLLEAKTIASSQLGVGSDAEIRKTESTVIDGQIQALLNIANRQFNNVSLFGGNRGAVAGGQVFEELLGGIRYAGSDQNLEADVGGINYQPFTSNGVDAFGALSTRIQSVIDLDPQATSQIRLADIDGAQFRGVSKGSILVNVDSTVVVVDLSGADILGDVVTRVNDAIDSVDPTAGALAIVGPGFELAATVGHTIEIKELGMGQTAADLGIKLLSAEGVPVAGPPVNVRLTERIQLADLGTIVDFASGLSITQGGVTQTADFSSAATIQDLVNVIDRMELGLRLQINATANGLDLISEVSGVDLSVGENGGSTAGDLGLRTYGTATALADFRNGLGVQSIVGEDDFGFTLHDGTTFGVNLDGVTTVAALITAIEGAAAAAGVTVGVDFIVSLAGTGNGIVFTDNTGGPNDFQIENLGLSLAADHLGIKKNSDAGSTIQGDDNVTVRVESVFTHLINLRDALKNNDELGMTLAAGALEDDLETATQTRAQVGIQAQRVQLHQDRSFDLELTEKTMLSELQDSELTEVITRFAQLHQQLLASLQLGAQNLRVSLFDYLR